MSLQNQVAGSASKYDAQKKAAKALLESITKTVEEIETAKLDYDSRITRLTELARAYSLVVHGKE
ncbi:hypothetical protein ABZ753_31070 [Streptomyces griseoincarnatus]